MDRVYDLPYEAWFWGTAPAVAFTATVIYKYFLKNRGYWEKKNIPCHNSTLIGNVIEEKLWDIHEVEMRRYQKYGKVYGRYDGDTPVLTIGDLDLLKRILEKEHRDFVNRRCVQVGDPIGDNMLPVLMDEDWKRVRILVSKLFTPGKINEMLPKMHKCGNRTIEYLRGKADAGDPVDLDCAFGAYIVDIIASCAFGYEIDSLRTPNDPFVTNARRFFEKGKPWKSVFAQHCPGLMRFFKMALFDKQATEFFRDFTLAIIERRRDENEAPDDYLQALMSFPNEAPDPGVPRYEAKYITDEETISQCVLFFMAGYDTNLSLIQVTMYHLAINQEIQDRLYDEIIDVIGDEEITDKRILKRMEYLGRIIDEGLRLASSCVRMERTVTKRHYLESLDFWLDEGSLISIPYYCIHHDPAYWPDPHKFDPERFTKEAKLLRPVHAYMPFGRGPRMCVAKEFALTEAMLGLVKILKVFRVVPCKETVIPIKYTAKLAQLVPEPVFLKFEYR